MHFPVVFAAHVAVPLVEMQAAGAHEPHVAVDAAAGVPARVVARVVHAHHDVVVALPHEVAHVAAETAVAIDILAAVVSVDPERRLVVGALEVEHRAPLEVVGRECEGLLIPARTAHGESRLKPADALCGEGPDDGASRRCCRFGLHAPVVGQRECAPGVGRAGVADGAAAVAQREAPVAVDTLFAFHCCGADGQQGNEDEGEVFFHGLTGVFGHKDNK